MPKRIPTWQQFKCLPRVLSQKEKVTLSISLSIFLLSLITLVNQLYLRATVPVPAYGGSYTEGLVGSPRFINPLLAPGNDIDRDISFLTFSGLFTFDETGNVVPDLATTYQVSENQKEYTVELQENLQWHDGEPFTIDDVIFTIQTIQDPDFKSPLRANFTGVSVSKISDRTAMFTLPEPSPAFLKTLTVGIIPQHVWYSIPAAQVHLAEVNLKPIGSGPFRFKSLMKDSTGSVRSITLERYESYHGKKPFIEEITLKFYPDVESAIDALKNKNIEGISFLPLEHKTSLERTSAVHLYILDLPQHRALFFNPEKNDILKDRNVRRALSYSIDRKRIVQEVLNGNGKAVIAPVIPGITPTSTDVLFDAAKAAGAIEESGWKLREETAIRNKDDRELTFTLTTVGQPENIKTANIIAENWKALGIDTRINIVPKQKIRTEVINTRNYEVLLFGQLTTSCQDTYAYWHSSQTRHPGNNFSIFANKDIDAALSRLQDEADPEQQKTLCQQVSDKLVNEAFAVFLYTPSYLYPVSNNIKGPGDFQHVSVPSDRFARITDWYVKTQRKWK